MTRRMPIRNGICWQAHAEICRLQQRWT